MTESGQHSHRVSIDHKLQLPIQFMPDHLKEILFPIILVLCLFAVASAHSPFSWYKTRQVTIHLVVDLLLPDRWSGTLTVPNQLSFLTLDGCTLVRDRNDPPGDAHFLLTHASLVPGNPEKGCGATD